MFSVITFKSYKIVPHGFIIGSLILNTIICDMCLQDFACNIFN